MIPEYKLYHGAVLADIVDRVDGPVSFRELSDPGRLLNYVINDSVGVQIKYSTARLRPWGFSFPEDHIDSLRKLMALYPHTFVVLVCRTDGFVSIPASALLQSLWKAKRGHASLRVDRRKREMYSVHGPAGEFEFKFRTTSEPIVEVLNSIGTPIVVDEPVATRIDRKF